MFSYNDINLVATSRPTNFFKGDVTERFATTIFSATQRCNEDRCDIATLCCAKNRHGNRPV